MEKIFLASASPRRVKLLKILGLPFVQKVSNVAETLTGVIEPAMFAQALAVAKARDVAKEQRGGFIIGADTIVVHDGKILGKPQDSADAVRMLKILNGNRHQVISGVAVIDARTGKERADHEVTDVVFRQLSEEEIICYVNTGESMDKAGAYGIQGIGAILVKEIKGCYNNVVGLPLTLLVEILGDMGFNVWNLIGKGDDCGNTT